MPAIVSSPAWTLRVVLLFVTFVAIGCGDDSSTATDSSLAQESSSSQVLELRIAGRATDGLLCPGDRRPCITYNGTLDLDDGDLVFVTGRLVDGILEVDSQQALPDRSRRDYSNQCQDQDLSTPPPSGLLETLYEGDPAARPEGFVDAWDSDDGVLHIGVSGDSSPTERFVESAGATDQVCVVTGFPHSDAVLEMVQAAAGAAALDARFDNWSSTRDAWEGSVTLSLPKVGQDLRTQLDEISIANDGVVIEVETTVEVLNGSVADYEEALMSAGVTPDPAAQLIARCGQVVFTAVPPDLDEFPPLDSEAREALDQLVTDTGTVSGSVAEATQWSIALRTEGELVLFGQPEDPERNDWASVEFENRDGVWTPNRWGGCRVQIDAPGLGPATVGLDPDNPPNPEDTELMLLINEQECASGRPPDDREVVVLATETAETVSVLVLVAPVEGGAECPSNPWHPVTVELDAPLGDRELLDIHQYPPQSVADAEQ